MYFSIKIGLLLVGDRSVSAYPCKVWPQDMRHSDAVARPLPITLTVNHDTTLNIGSKDT